MHMLMGEETVTMAEAAALVQVSPSTIWRWINQGDLPAYRVGLRRVRIKVADLHRMVAPRQARPQGEADDQRRSRELSPAQRQRGLRALQQLRELQMELLRKRGGRPFPDAADLLRDLRTERDDSNT